MKKRFSFALLVAGALTATALLFASGSAAATTTDVYCPGDDLQSVINAASPGDTLRIHGVCYGNFYNNGTELTFQGIGSGAALDGQGNGSVLEIGERNVTLQNLTIRHGLGDGEGGGLDIDGAEDSNCSLVVTLIGVTVTLNRVPDDGSSDSGQGGGISVECATLNLTNSVVSWNWAGEDGAGIEAYGGSLVNLTGSTITRNSADGDGGGIDIDESQLSAIASTISLNTANSDGGGISIEKSDVLLQSTRVTSNRASDYGGGIYDEGGSPECLTTGCANTEPAPIFGAPLVIDSGLTVIGSSVDHNLSMSGDGGGIYNDDEEGDSPVTIQGSAVSFNNATDEGGRGGGIANFACDNTASVLVTGSTFKGNGARKGDGGAIYNEGEGGCSGAALVTIALSGLSNAPNNLNQNQAIRGGGVANEQFGALASLSIQAKAQITGNKASDTGGGIWNNCGSLLKTGGNVLLNTPNNIVSGCWPVT